MFLINKELFCRYIPHCTVHQINFQGTFQIELCLSVIILHNTNRCICYIINHSPTKLLLMQWFEETVINKLMFCRIHIFIRSDLTYTYLHSFIEYSYNNVCTHGLYCYSNYWSRLHNTSHTWGIFCLVHFCIFHSSRRALCVKLQFVGVFSNPRGRINNSIL